MSEMWKPAPIETYQQWIETIRDEAEERLTDWERSFLDNIEGMLAFGQNLSRGRAETLEKIYAEKTK